MSKNTLNLFPARVAIGNVQPDGTVLMTPEFSRALTAVLARIGGPNGMSSDDLAALAAFGVDVPAASDTRSKDVAAALTWTQSIDRRVLDDIRKEIAMIPDYSAAFGSLGTMARQNANAVAITGGTINGTSIGATARNSGRFTTLSAGTGSPTYRFVVSNNGAQGLEFDSDGSAFGAGTTGILAYDRVAAGYVQLTVAASTISLRATNTTRISVNGTGIGFFGATPVGKPTVTGSRGGNAALASALTAWAALGLITDSTTA
jgi:hypothetical protein